MSVTADGVTYLYEYTPSEREQSEDEREFDKTEIILDHLKAARDGFRALRHSPPDAQDMIDKIASVESRMLRVKTDASMRIVRSSLKGD